MPIVLMLIILWECSAGEPKSEQFTDIGQWGHWAGAVLLAFAVFLNTTSTAYILRSTFPWFICTPAHALFPGKFDQRHLPRIYWSSAPFDRLLGLPRWITLFFIDEYLSTRVWLRDPYEASLECILEENNKFNVKDDLDNRQSMLSISSAGV